MGALSCNASDVTYTLGAFACEVRAGAFPTKDHAHSPSHSAAHGGPARHPGGPGVRRPRAARGAPPRVRPHRGVSPRRPPEPHARGAAFRRALRAGGRRDDRLRRGPDRSPLRRLPPGALRRRVHGGAEALLDRRLRRRDLRREGRPAARRAAAARRAFDDGQRDPRALEGAARRPIESAIRSCGSDRHPDPQGAGSRAKVEKPTTGVGARCSSSAATSGSTPSRSQACRFSSGCTL